MKFGQELQKNIDGGSKEFPFQKQWDIKAQDFRKLLADTRPTLRMTHRLKYSQNAQEASNTQESSTPSSASSRDTVTIIDSEDDHEPLQRTPKKRPHKATPTTPVNAPRLNDGTPTPTAMVTNTSNNTKLTNTAKVKSNCFELLEVRSIIQDAYVGGIPGQLHPKAIEDMVQVSMGHWKEPLELFLQATKDLSENMVFELIYSVFGHHQNTRYFDVILDTCRSFFADTFDQQRKLNQRIFAWEMAKPKTHNDEAMNLARERALTALQNHSRETRAHNVIEEQENRTGKFTYNSARKEKVAKVPEKDLKPESYGRELIALSFVKAFYEIAYSRFVDIICSSIHCEVFGKCRDGLFNIMRDNFGVLESNGKLF